MNYLHQYILESQVNYPQLFKHPINVLNHILYTNGNGVEFVNGNPVQIVHFYREIPFKDYYQQELSRDQMIHYFEKYTDNSLEIEYDKRVLFAVDELEKQEIWHDLVQEFRNKYNDIIWVDTIEFTDFYNEDKILEMLNSTDDKYYHYLYLSEGYYDQCKLNENTDKMLLKIALTMSKAYIMYLSNITLDNFDCRRNPFGKFNFDEFDTVSRKSISLLMADVERIKGYLFSNSP